MNNTDSIIQRIHHWAITQPDKIALTYCDDKGAKTAEFTYRRLDIVTHSLSRIFLEKFQLKPKDRIMLVYPPCIDFIIVFLSCIRAGVVPVPVYPPQPTGIKKNIHLFAGIQKNCEANTVFCNGDYHRLKKATDMKNLFLLSGSEWPTMDWFVTDSYISKAITETEIPSDSSVRSASPNSLCFLQYTSGSTSFPKGVMITSDNLRCNMNMIVRSLHANTSTIVVSWLPQYHDMGLIGSTLSLLYCGGSGAYLSPLSFIINPCLWLLLVSRYKATHLQAPNFAYSLILRRLSSFTAKNQLDLSSVRHVFNAAEPINVVVAKQFVQACCEFGLSTNAMSGGYGLAESCVYVSDGGQCVIRLRREEYEKENLVDCVSVVDCVTGDVDKYQRGESSDLLMYSCGYVNKNEDMKIVIAKDGHVLQECMVGIIYLQSPCIAAGYYPSNTTSFENQLTDQTGIWLDTGDLGFIHDNQLYVCGRFKDLIIIHGKNYYPQDIESSCSRIHDVKQGSVAAISSHQNGHEVMIVILELHSLSYTEQQYHELSISLRKVIGEDSGISPYEIIFIKPRSIIKTTSGKISRHAIAKKYESDCLEIIFRASTHIEEIGHDYGHIIGIISDDNEQEKEVDDCLIGVCKGGISNEISSLPSIVDGVDTLVIHGDELETVLLEDICFICGIQSYTVTPSDSLEMMSLDSLRRAQLKGILEQNYGAEVSTEMIFDVNTTFEQLVHTVDAMKKRKPIVRELIDSQENGMKEGLLATAAYAPPERTIKNLAKLSMPEKESSRTEHYRQSSSSSYYRSSRKEGHEREQYKPPYENKERKEVIEKPNMNLMSRHVTGSYMLRIIESQSLENISVDSINSLTEEIRGLTKDLKIWKQARKDDIDGKTVSPVPFVIWKRKILSPSSDKMVPVISYRNSRIMNRILEQINNRKEFSKVEENDSKGQEERNRNERDQPPRDTYL